MNAGKRSKAIVRGRLARDVIADVKAPAKKRSRRKVVGGVKVGKQKMTGDQLVISKKLRQPLSPLAASLLETAGDMHEVGIMRDADYEKITMRHLGRMGDVVIVRKISGLQIRRMREQARMSQSVFAKVLNITSGYVSQMERGEKEPTGSTLAMLNVIKRKGINSVLE
jgi:putative transcriptional regulator